MPVGLIRQNFQEFSTVGGGTYGFTDVRIRQTVVRAMADYLVATGMWSIAGETVPTASFTSTSTYYYIWLKFKSSDHLIRISVQGGNIYAMNIALFKSDSTTTAITAFQPAMQGTESSYPFAAISLNAFYGDAWMACMFGGYSLTSFIDMNAASSYSYGFGGAVMEDLFNPATTTDIVYFSSATNRTLINNLYTADTCWYRDDTDIAFRFIGLSVPSTVSGQDLMMQNQGFAYSDWRVKEFFSITNSGAYSAGAILIIDGHYYWLATSSVVWHLGKVPA